MNKIATILLAITLVVSASAANACKSVGDVKEVLNSGMYTTLITSDGTFTFSKPMAVRNTVNSSYRHAPACYDSLHNTLTYTLPGGGTATEKVE